MEPAKPLSSSVSQPQSADIEKTKKVPLTQSDIHYSKHQRALVDLFQPLASHQDCPNRHLHYDEYVRYLLLLFFTPVIRSMRGLQGASDLEFIQTRFKLPRFSLGAFSEAGGRFDSELLIPHIQRLVAQLDEAKREERFASLDREPVAVDGSLLHAVPRMLWALWLDEQNRAAKLHLQFSLWKKAPRKAFVTNANTGEVKTLWENLEAGMFYVMDRGYRKYALLRAISQAQSSFLVRLQNNASYEVLEERVVSPEAAAAGVQRDMVVRLGSTKDSALMDRPTRLLQLRVRSESSLMSRPCNKRVASTKKHREMPHEHILLLATDRLDLDAFLLALLYKFRWMIETFFCWFKHVLDANHPISERQNGFRIVVYVALIASLLISLWTGARPSKRLYEMLCWHSLGIATDQELAALIEKEKAKTKR
jgi:hypothetical protein